MLIKVVLQISPVCQLYCTRGTEMDKFMLYPSCTVGIKCIMYMIDKWVLVVSIWTPITSISYYESLLTLGT